jgi:hypothetical protein
MDVSSNLQEITFYTVSPALSLRRCSDAVEQAVKHGGRAEYERMQKIYTDAKSPAQQEAAMYVICDLYTLPSHERS